MSEGREDGLLDELVNRIVSQAAAGDVWEEICQRYAVVNEEQLNRLKDERPSGQWQQMQIAFSGQMRGLFGVAAIAVFYWAEIARVARLLKAYQGAAEVLSGMCAEIAARAYQMGYDDGSEAGGENGCCTEHPEAVVRRLPDRLRGELTDQLLGERRTGELSRLHGTWLALKQFLRDKWELNEEAFLHLPFIQIAEEPDVPMEKMQMNIQRRKQKAGLVGVIDDETRETVFRLHDIWRALEAFLKNRWGITEPEGLWQLPMIAVTDHMLNVLGEARQVEPCQETKKQMLGALRKTYRAFSEDNSCEER